MKQVKLPPALRRFEKQYFKALRKVVPATVEEKEMVLKSIRAEAVNGWQDETNSSIHKVTQYHAWSAYLVFVTNKKLIGAIPDIDTRLGIIETALHQPSAKWIKLFTKLMLFTSLDRFKSLKKYAMLQVPKQYGPEFNFATLENSDTSFIQAVNKCFYNDYFRNLGTPYLTRLFCSFDRIWIDELKPERDNVRFQRPTTLADGDQCCSFEFHRLD